MQRMFAGGGRPRFKSADDPLPSLAFPVWVSSGTTCSVVFGRDTVKFPSPSGKAAWGLGRIKYWRRQKLVGRAKTATITLEGDRWTLAVACEVTAPARTAPTAAVGLDLGVATHVAASDGTSYEFVPATTRARLTKRLKRLQRDVSRARRGSKRRRIKVAKLAKAHAAAADARRTTQHTVARRIVTAYGTVVVEKLNVRNMTRSAAGSLEAPGSNVRAKAGLNREILAVAPYAFRLALSQKLARTGGKLVAVDPRHTSQTCSACGVVDAASRRSQSEFICTSCGHQAHADFNAARNILRRGLDGEVPPRREATNGRRRTVGAASPRQRSQTAPASAFASGDSNKSQVNNLVEDRFR